MEYKYKQTGFTLIELSIVLVIISLIVGGVIGGKSLIESAKINATITDVNQYRAAMNNFQLQYDALPGDFREATSYWTGGVTNNGNGDGKISLLPDLIETANSWEHLSLAGIIEGSYDGAPGLIDGNTRFDFPKTPHDTYWWMQYYPISYVGVTYYEGHTIRTGINTTGHWCPGTPLSAVLSIEKKIDDGMPHGGKIMVGAQCDLSLPVCQTWSSYEKGNTQTAICALHFLLE